MTKKITLFLAASALACSLAAAPAGIRSAHAQEEKAPPFSFSGGVDFPTAYYFRGFLQQDEGLITQPYANLYWNMYKGKDLTITPWVGIWNSFHEEKGAGRKKYYEVDYLAGVDFGLGPLTIGTGYTYYHSPSDSFADIQEAELKFSFNDSELVKITKFPFPLNPYVKFNFETKDKGGTEDSYMEVGIRPSFEGKIGAVPFTFGIPVTVGMSLEDYYFKKNGQEATLGYVSVAGTVSIPLPMPKEAGAWSLNLRVEYLYFDAHSTRSANNNHGTDVIGTVGIAVSF